MSSPIQKIKQGLINGDLKEIAEGYNLLTGEDISVGEKQGMLTREDLLVTINQLCDAFENYNGKPCKINKVETKKPKKEVTQQRGVYGNQTVPITEKAAADEVEKNKKNVVDKPRRKPKQVYKVNCSICNNPFNSDVEVGENMGKRCNDCLVKAINGRE